jgi:DNA helicase HerA-like ATPase
VFVKELEGTLMELTEAPETRFRYVVWFDYTQKAINEIQDGTLLAVPNFAGNGETHRYSVLEVTTILPTHYALNAGTGGYPGFVVEAARSAAEDWETQDTSSTEDTTKIRVVAIPTNLEIIEPLTGETQIGPESNIAMVGSKVRILDTKYSNLIANNGIDKENERNLTIIGTLTRDDNVEILLRIEELYRTHFAIFGFTGVGKSNLLSTIVSKVLNDAQEPLKLVFFDLMSEYTVLLLDQFLSEKVMGRILTVGRHTLPEGLFQYLNDMPQKPGLDVATKQLLRYTLMPKALVKDREKIGKALQEIISRKLIRYFHEAQSISVYDFFFSSSVVTWAKNRQAVKAGQRSELAKRALRSCSLGDYKATRFNPDVARRIREALERELNLPTGAEYKKDGDFTNHLSKLEDLERESGETFSTGTTLADLVNDLNDEKHASLWVIQAHNPHELRGFAKRLGDEIYESRRMAGRIDPLVSFIFDEADEFIRRDATGSYQESAEIAQTLARRGRKFGLGLGIATQRIRYLDTNIMAQPHTYFISKLPRLSDRQAVAEAFGISEELLNQTFKFKKGNWLLMSHDAAGLEAIPIPIKTPDANRRLSDWLRSRK